MKAIGMVLLGELALGGCSNRASVLTAGKKSDSFLSQNVPCYPSFAEIVKAVMPAVVNIAASQKGSIRGPSSKHSLGSGFIISKDGYILTNNHVVEGKKGITVRLPDQQEFEANVVITGKGIDIALIKIEPREPLPALRIGNPSELQLGDWVLAIGSPFGLAHTVTAGIVSAKDRVIGQGPYDGFIQTDASINPGNSGGPLINLKGEVVGINTAIVGGAGANVGIGFAIPIDLAKNVIGKYGSR
jgi:serine protease Do